MSDFQEEVKKLAQLYDCFERVEPREKTQHPIRYNRKQRKAIHNYKVFRKMENPFTPFYEDDNGENKKEGICFYRLIETYHLATILFDSDSDSEDELDPVTQGIKKKFLIKRTKTGSRNFLRTHSHGRI